MKYWWIVILFFPALLFSDIGEFNSNLLYSPKWGAGGSFSFYHQNNMLPSSKVGYLSFAINGFYMPIKGLYIGGQWKLSTTSRSYPKKEHLNSVGDVSLWSKYNFFTYNNIHLWIEGALFLFAPVEDESNYGDTSSYLLNFTAIYNWGRFIPELTLGYFYDRRVNFSSTEPDDFERIAWQQVDYTWSHISPKIYYMGNDYNIFLGYRKEILYSSNISFSKLPSYLFTGTKIKIFGNYYITAKIRWKLFSGNLKGYPYQPWIMIFTGVSYLAGTTRRNNIVQISKERANLNIIIKNITYGINVRLNGISPDSINDNQIRYLNLLPGNYNLTVTAPGYKKLTTTVTINKGISKTINITLKKEIKPASLMGIVLSSGIPVERAIVKISGPITTTTQTNKDGIFNVENLPPGSYSVSVTASDYQKKIKYVELTSGQKEVTRIQLKEIEYPHAVLTLFIMGTNKKPITNYSFKIYASKFRVLKRNKGKLKLYVAPGEIKIIVSSPGYKDKKLLFTVGDGDEITTTVKLKKK